MSTMSDLDLQLREINEAMQETDFERCSCGRHRSDQCAFCASAAKGLLQEQPIDSVGRTLRDAFSAVDDLVILANREDTKAAVLAERVLIGQLMVRVQLLASFAMINTPSKLKVVGSAHQ